jgi:hypothetical protein
MKKLIGSAVLAMLLGLSAALVAPSVAVAEPTCIPAMLSTGGCTPDMGLPIEELGLIQIGDVLPACRTEGADIPSLQTSNPSFLAGH